MIGFNNKKGFSLIEVLIAILIFSFGMLGLASAHITGIKLTQESALRFQANVLADDMVERMRANLDVANNTNFYTTATQGIIPNCELTTCSTEDLANWDKDQWIQKIARSLPDGEGSIESDAGVPKRYTVKISYAGSSNNNEEVIVNAVL